ncbi:MAG: hypothetical protein ACLU8F_04215 [Clostridia bacterium]
MSENKFKKTLQYTPSYEQMLAQKRKEELKRYNQIFDKPEAISETANIIAILRNEMIHHFPEVDFDIEFRIKSRRSTLQKIANKIEEVKQTHSSLTLPILYDLIGMTIIIHDIKPPKDRNTFSFKSNTKIEKYMIQKELGHSILSKLPTIFQEITHSIDALRENTALNYTAKDISRNLKKLQDSFVILENVAKRASIKNINFAKLECYHQMSEEILNHIKEKFYQEDIFESLTSEEEKLDYLSQIKNYLSRSYPRYYYFY